MDRQERMEKKNENLGTEICENIDTLYIISKFVMQKIITRMKEKGINNVEWIDRKEWRRKIKL